jgi:PAS domain S-box-containing protein
LEASEKAETGAGRRSLPTAGRFLAVFALLALAMLATGYFYYQAHAQQLRAEVAKQLSAIADLKVREITQWRHERLEDGATFVDNDSFAERVQDRLAHPDSPQVHSRLTTWLRRFRDASRYDRVFLVDPRGNEIAMAPAASEAMTDQTKRGFADRLRDGDVGFLDFHRDSADGRVHLSVLVPIRSTDGEHRPLALLVLRIDPTAKLYPIIQRWPIPSDTAETLLVRREGDQVLFLNELRFRRDAALNLSFPLTRLSLPAVQAVLGREGPFQGVDYRAQQVVAELRKVPDSPWLLVARVDVAEAYAPLAQSRRQIAAFVAVLVLGSGALTWTARRQQLARFYREKYETAEALRTSESRYRALVENAPVAVFISRQHRVADANPACLRLLGATSAEQLLGRTSLGLFHPDCHEVIAERSRQLHTQGGAVPPIEQRLVRLDGTTVEVEVAAAAFADRGDRANLVVMNDITERKRAERELRASEAELRQRNDELMRFTYTVSHDLKSPLVTIQSFLGYLEQDVARKDAEATTKDLGFIRGAAQKMARLLDDLLQLSRVGRVKSPSMDVPLRSVIAEAQSLVAGHITQRGVRVEVTPEPIILHGDPMRLTELFQNLLDNAVKFMGAEPEPLVEVTTEKTDGEIIITVRDNGIGIDPRHTAKLFGLFEKLDASSEGTGIGLALVRRIVETHGGRIWAESAGPGQGARFRFTLAGTRFARGPEGQMT